MGEITPMPARPTELVCGCGSVWFDTSVQFDARTGDVVSYAATGAKCHHCQRPVDIPSRGIEGKNT